MESVLFCSDQHFDSVYCNRAKLKEHLDQAKEGNHRIFFLGDWWDAMQGSSDKRGSKSGVRKEYQRNDYLNALVEETVEFLEPYSKNIAIWAKGNHETSIIKHAEFDLLSACVRELNLKTGSDILVGPYTGWIILRCRHKNTATRKTFGSLNVAYTHGSGGGGPVTKGVIQTNRRSVYLPDAHLVVGGHIHESWAVEINRERLGTHGQTWIDTQWHLQLPTYKDEFSVKGDGWWHETGKGPRPMGGWWADIQVIWSNYFKREILQITPRRAC
tara:strand:- start:1276 stop:2091 length:816 start_codon:yes stop_codon:yes gene_type:complete